MVLDLNSDVCISYRIIGHSEWMLVAFMEILTFSVGLLLLSWTKLLFGFEAQKEN